MATADRTHAPQGDRSARRAYLAAAVCSAAMIGAQMAGKATRDTLFLTYFDVPLLPRMVVTSALVSLLFAVLVARWMTTLTPGRLVPLAFGASALLLIGEWVLLGLEPSVAAIVVYLHYGALGALLISGFWSVVNERFDPRTAKTYVGRIAAAGTVGGVLGGLLAARVAVWSSVGTMLPLLAVLQALCGLFLLAVGPRRGTAPQPASEPRVQQRAERSGLEVIARTPYLRGLVVLVVLLTTGEVLIDYAFKASTTAAIGRGEALLRFFALFYTGLGVLTFAVQALAGRAALQRLGLTRTVALLPAGTLAGSMGALMIPGLPSVAGVRGIEQVLRNGLYRPGYELLFTPVAPAQKRAAKALVDVGVVRLGDMLGGGLVQVAVLISAVLAPRALLAVAAVLSLAAAAVALSLRSGYVRTLERSLLSRAIQLDLDEVQDATTRSTVMQSTGGRAFGVEPVGPGPTAERVPVGPEAPPDPELRRMVELRSRVPERVRAALLESPLTPPLVPHTIPLLAWDAVLTDVVTALRRVAPSVTGQLVDRLLDPEEDFTVRRRLPLVLVACPTDRAVDGLLRGLHDARFEVRVRCGRALSRLLELDPSLHVARDRAVAAVLREVAVDRRVWESHRLLDRTEDDAWSPIVDEVLRERAHRGLEHVFTVLALILPRQPLKLAFRGLYTDDPILRGTALEYLETALPPEVRASLWPFLEDTGARPAAARRSAEDVAKSLMASKESIAMNLEVLRQRRRESGG